MHTCGGAEKQFFPLSNSRGLLGLEGRTKLALHNPGEEAPREGQGHTLATQLQRPITSPHAQASAQTIKSEALDCRIAITRHGHLTPQVIPHAATFKTQRTRPVPLKFQQAYTSSGQLAEIHPVSLGLVLRLCAPDTLPGDADPAGPQTSPGIARA